MDIDIGRFSLISRLIESFSMNAGSFGTDILIALITAAVFYISGWIIFSMKNFS
jgi:hypothetical protein